MNFQKAKYTRMVGFEWNPPMNNSCQLYPSIWKCCAAKFDGKTLVASKVLSSYFIVEKFYSTDDGETLERKRIFETFLNPTSCFYFDLFLH